MELLGSPTQPDYLNRDMIDDLERSRDEDSAVIVRSPRVLDPKEEMKDDEEVESSLFLTASNESRPSDDHKAEAKPSRGPRRRTLASRKVKGKGKAKATEEDLAEQSQLGDDDHEHGLGISEDPQGVHLDGQQADGLPVADKIPIPDQPLRRSISPPLEHAINDEQPLSDTEEKQIIEDTHSYEDEQAISADLEVDPKSEANEVAVASATADDEIDSHQSQEQLPNGVLQPEIDQGDVIHAEPDHIVEESDTAHQPISGLQQENPLIEQAVENDAVLQQTASSPQPDILVDAHDAQNDRASSPYDGPQQEVPPSETSASTSLPTAAPWTLYTSQTGMLYPALPSSTPALLDPAPVEQENIDVVEEVVDITPPSLPSHSADALTEDVEPVEVHMLESERTGLGDDEMTAADDDSMSVHLPNGIVDHGFTNGVSPQQVDEGIARSTEELGETEHVVEPESELSQDGGEPPKQPPHHASITQPPVIDFTADDSDDEEEEKILLPTPALAPAPAPVPDSQTGFLRKKSSGLLRGPLFQASASASQPRTFASSPSASSWRDGDDATSLVRAMGRASLARSPPPLRPLGSSPPPQSARSMSGSSSIGDVFANQRYQRPHRKRLSILHKEHKAKIKERNQRGMLALKTFYQKHASSLRHAGFSDASSFDDWLNYAEVVNRLSTSTAPAKSKALAVEALANRDPLEQRQLRLILGKSRATESRIAIKPGKEQRRLRREQQLKERRRRGILGRPALPSQLQPDQEAAVRAILSDPTWKSTIPGATAGYSDVVRLKPGQWMNDETITFYMTMINQRSQQAEQERSKAGYDKSRWDSFYRVHAFNSHFWAKFSSSGYASVSRWTRKVNIFEKDVILVPCNLGNSHWTCAAINMRKKRFEYYDSMAGRNRPLLSHLREYVKKEMVDKKREGAVDLNE